MREMGGKCNQGADENRLGLRAAHGILANGCDRFSRQERETAMIQKGTSKPRPRQPSKKVPRKDRPNAEGIAKAVAEIKKLKAPNRKAAKVLRLIEEWLKDDSGYDEEAWPELKKALDEERDRVGARRLFDG
jgi:hypothetical protein